MTLPFARFLDGFYAVLVRDDEVLARALLAGGARILQVRLKPAHADEIVRVARMARRVCTELGAALVVNDRVDLALAVGADAVHLGQTDMPIEAARAVAGERLAIGISTHDLGQVRCAVAARPAYIAYGPIFATTTKQDPDPVQGIDALRAAVDAAGGIPVVAIGGIRPSHARDLYATGASCLCAISSVNSSGPVSSVTAAARGLARDICS